MKILIKTNKIKYCPKTVKNKIVSIYYLFGIPIFRTARYRVFSNVFDSTFN